MSILASTSPESSSTAAPSQSNPNANVLRIVWPHVVLGLIGIAISLYSVKLHAIVKAGGSACGISNGISCDKVLASAWAAPMGIPLGYFGALFFALIVLTAISTLPAHTPPRQIALPRLALATVGVLGSFALTLISITQIGALCPICLATHATTLSNFIYAVWNYQTAL